MAIGLDLDTDDFRHDKFHLLAPFERTHAHNIGDLYTVTCRGTPSLLSLQPDGEVSRKHAINNRFPLKFAMKLSGDFRDIYMRTTKLRLNPHDVYKIQMDARDLLRPVKEIRNYHGCFL